MDSRNKLIEMIDEIDGVSANDTVIIMDLIKWMPEHQIAQFIEDTIEIHELYGDCPNPNEEIWAETEDDEVCDEDYFFREGAKAAEALKKERIEAYRADRERYLQLMQCSEV